MIGHVYNFLETIVGLAALFIGSQPNKHALLARVFQATFTFNSVNGKIHTHSIIEITCYRALQRTLVINPLDHI